MIKSETALRITFITRLELLFWDAVIQVVGILCQARENLSRVHIQRPTFPQLTGWQAGILAILMLLGATSGLITGVILACLRLYK